MKKITFLLAFISFTFCILAQESTEKVSVEVRAGFLGNSMAISQSTLDGLVDKGYTARQSMKTGACAGLVANFNLKGNWGLQAGLMYELQRSGQTQASVYEDENKTRFSFASQNIYSLNHLRLPLLVQYHFSKAENHFLIGMGVFADCALTGSVVYDASAVIDSLDENGHSVRTEYVASGSLDLLKEGKQYLYYHKDNEDYTSKYLITSSRIFNRFDFGVALEFGYQVGNFYIGVQGNMGLLNLTYPGFLQTAYFQRNYNVQVQVGYKISNF